MNALILLVLTWLSFFEPIQLSASPLDSNLTMYQDLLSYFWTGTDDELYLNVEISKDLEFSNSYHTFKLNNDLSQGCELVCKPITQGTVFSDGFEVQEIKLTVVLNTDDNRNKVPYKISKTYLLKKIDEHGVTLSKSSEFKQESTLNNPAIDLTQPPYFCVIIDTPYKGVISFKNSFPFSEIQ